ncbi:MAG: hypothetical protein ACRDZ5_07570 [Acidimicrobiales bacterium]
MKGSADIESLLVDWTVAAHRMIAEHEVLQKLLESEPELVTVQLSVEAPRLVALVRSFLARLDPRELKAGLEVNEAADYVARMVLSFISSPGRWDLHDPAQVGVLVRSELLAGLLPARPES